MSQSSIYSSRIKRALAYIEAHLDEKILLDELAAHAHFSSFHFHRIFTAYVDETVGDYIQRKKLETASRQLAYTDKKVATVAYELGYSSLSTFSRAFKKQFDCTPSYYRKHGLPEKSKIRKTLPDIPHYLADSKEVFAVQVKQLAFRKLAYISVRNSFEAGKSLRALQQLIAWSKDAGIYEQGTLMGMSADDVLVTPKSKYRYLVAISLPDDFQLEHSQIELMVLRSRQYACLKVSGPIEKVIGAYNFLFRSWLLNSDFEPCNSPAMEIFLNKQNATDWSNFELELALPVQPLIHY
ncbi:MAG: helix-turn-helix domain-containing protein [Bacteroidota bacterium]